MNVKDFGAIGDGISNDTDAIQAAIDALPAILPPEAFKEDEDGTGGTGEVFLPPGSYLVQDTLRLRHGMTFRGAGPYATFILHDAGSNPCLLVQGGNGTGENVRGVRIQALAVIGKTDSSTPGLAIQLHRAIDNHLSDLLIRHVNGGIYLTTSWANRFTNVKISQLSGGDCLRLEGDSNSASIIGCRFTPGLLGGQRGIFVDPSPYETQGVGAIVGCTFDAGPVGIEVKGALNMLIAGCYFEQQEFSIKAAGSHGLTIVGNYFNCGREVATWNPRAIDLNALGVLVAGNEFFWAGKNPPDAAIRLDAQTSLTAFVGNAFTGGWKRAVEGPLGDNFGHFYAEMMNGAPDERLRYPLRLTARQFGFLDLPVILPPDAPCVPPTPDDATLGPEGCLGREIDRFARLFVSDSDGKMELRVRLRGSDRVLATE